MAHLRELSAALGTELPRFETERLRIAIACPEMGGAMARFFAANWEGHLDRWSPPAAPRLFDAQFWEERLAYAAEEWRSGTAARFVLQPLAADADEVVGTCNYTSVVRGPFQACFLGYQVAKANEGRGFMSEALSLLNPYVFREMRLHRIMANYIPENARSAQLLERQGFVREGLARDYLYIDGAWRDHVLTALTNQEFDAAWILGGGSVRS